MVTVPSAVGGVSVRSGPADKRERLHWSRAMDAYGAMERRRRAAILAYAVGWSFEEESGKVFKTFSKFLVAIKIKTYEKGSTKTVRGQRLCEITAELQEQ